MENIYAARPTNINSHLSSGVCTGQGDEVVIIGVVVLICKHKPSQLRLGQKQVYHNQLDGISDQMCKLTVEMINMLFAVGKLIGLQNHRKLAERR